jgi:DNA-binding IscR family transcriptional regulator
LNRPASAISLADIIRAVDGPLVEVRGERPDDIAYRGQAQPLQKVWLALRASERAILDGVTLADVAEDNLPPVVLQYLT